MGQRKGKKSAVLQSAGLRQTNVAIQYSIFNNDKQTLWFRVMAKLFTGLLFPVSMHVFRPDMMNLSYLSECHRPVHAWLWVREISFCAEKPP
jgi:hypothetical protein